MEAIQTQVDPFYQPPFVVNEKKNRIYVFQFPAQIELAELGRRLYSFYIGQTDPSRGWVVDGEFLVRWADGDYSKMPERPKLLAWIDVHNDIQDHEIRVLMRKYGWYVNKNGSPEMLLHPTIKSWEVGINQVLSEITKLDNYYRQYEKKHGISPAIQRKKARNKEEDMFRIPPRDLIYDMCDTLKNVSKDAKIYVPRDAHGHFCDYLISMGFKNLYTDKDYPYFPKDIRASFSGLENVKLITEDEFNNMNFTVTIGNPPFDGVLHLKFLKECLLRSKTVRLTHPSSWLCRTEQKIERDVKKLLEGRVKKLTIYNGNAVFTSVQFDCPLVITEVEEKYDGPIEVHYVYSGNTYYVDSIYDMPTGFWEPRPEMLNLVSKFTELTQHSCLYDIVGKYKGKSFVSAPRTCGHAISKDPAVVCLNDFYTFFYRNSKILELDHNNKCFNLNNNSERDSLISYLKTKVARFGLAINKTSRDGYISRYLSKVPLPPLDRQWTEDSIMEYYNFTESERSFIDSFIPDYYDKEEQTQ